MQELDAERRAAILRGRTPPPLPEELDKKDVKQKRERDDRGHDRKRRKLAGEDDTDADIRLAASLSAPKDGKEEEAKILKLRNTKIDAPLTDHAGNIDLFPVDMKEAMKREKNAEVEREKRRKERALEDQYTMRFSNAAGRSGLEQPWYAAQQRLTESTGNDVVAQDYPLLENKNVWGNEDPRRKDRELARVTSNDPLAFMQKAQTQLKRSKEDKKRWATERDRELRELRATQEREDRRSRHCKRKKRDDDAAEDYPSNDLGDARTLQHKCRHAHRSRSRERSAHKSSHRRERRRSRSHSRDRNRDHGHSSSRRATKDKDQNLRKHVPMKDQLRT